MPALSERSCPPLPPIGHQRIIVLGSRSPRRRELLGSMTGIDHLRILPPLNSAEPGFDSLTADAQICQRLEEIVTLKHQDVCRQLPQQSWHSIECPPIVVVADTTVVTGPADGQRQVLGQPNSEHWQSEVREWLQSRLSGTTHEVWTAVLVSLGNQVRQAVVRSRVTFASISDADLDWYLSTNESPGKAGGYAIQGFAAAFVTHLDGSLTNVIGLPLLETVALIRSLSESSSPPDPTPVLPNDSSGDDGMTASGSPHDKQGLNPSGSV